MNEGSERAGSSSYKAKRLERGPWERVARLFAPLSLCPRAAQVPAMYTIHGKTAQHRVWQQACMRSTSLKDLYIDKTLVVNARLPHQLPKYYSFVHMAE